MKNWVKGILAVLGFAGGAAALFSIFANKDKEADADTSDEATEETDE